MHGNTGDALCKKITMQENKDRVRQGFDSGF